MTFDGESVPEPPLGPTTPLPPGPPQQPVPPAYPAPTEPPGAAGYPAQFPKSSTYAVVSLVLAIGSFVLCPVILAIAALVVASSADKEIKASNGWITGDGMVKAAKISAWINIALTILVVVVAIIVAALGVPTQFGTSVGA